MKCPKNHINQRKRFNDVGQTKLLLVGPLCMSPLLVTFTLHGTVWPHFHLSSVGYSINEVVTADI